MPSLPKLPDPENFFSVFDKASGVIDKGLNFIDKITGRLDQLGITDEGTPDKNPQFSSSRSGVSDEATLRYQLDHIITPLRQLELHLAEGCKIEGIPCDCCAKASFDVRNFSQETIPIAARQGQPTDIFAEMAAWAQNIEVIGSEASSRSGTYETSYHQESGAASRYRKQLQRMMDELRGVEECPSCEERSHALKDFMAHQRKEALAAMSPEARAKLKDKVSEIIDQGGAGGERAE